MFTRDGLAGLRGQQKEICSWNETTVAFAGENNLGEGIEEGAEVLMGIGVFIPEAPHLEELWKDHGLRAMRQPVQLKP